MKYVGNVTFRASKLIERSDMALVQRRNGEQIGFGQLDLSQFGTVLANMSPLEGPPRDKSGPAGLFS